MKISIEQFICGDGRLFGIVIGTSCYHYLKLDLYLYNRVIEIRIGIGNED